MNRLRLVTWLVVPLVVGTTAVASPAAASTYKGSVREAKYIKNCKKIGAL